MLRECERPLFGPECEEGTAVGTDRAAFGSSKEDEAGGTAAVSARVPPAASLVPAVEVLKFDPSMIRTSERA
jgi:hypothetical protein